MNNRMTTEEVEKYLKEHYPEKKETEEVVENKEPITPEDSKTDEVKEPGTPTDTPEEEKKNGGGDVTEVKDEKGTDKPDESKKEEKSHEEDGKAHKVAEDAQKGDKSQKKEQRQYTPEQYTIIRERTRRREQKKKYEEEIQKLKTELEKYKGLELQHFKDKDGNPDTGSYLDYKFKERDLKDQVQKLEADERAEEAAYIDRENDRRINLSFSDPREQEEYRQLLSSRGQSFLEALNERDPDGVVLNYLSSEEKYPIVLKKLMTDMNSLSRVFRAKDSFELRMNIAKFTDEVLNPSIKTPEQTVHTEAQEKKPGAVLENKMPTLGKQMTANQAPGGPRELKTRADWNEYLRTHPRGH